MSEQVRHRRTVEHEQRRYFERVPAPYSGPMSTAPFGSITDVAGVPAIIINQPTLQLTNITLVFGGVPPQTNQLQTVAFEHGRPAPFDLPLGQCIFVDAIFLPGTATCEIFNHEIQLLPRTLTIDGVEHPWRSEEKIFLPHRPPATLPGK